jgi:hypothetical protein
VLVHFSLTGVPSGVLKTHKMLVVGDWIEPLDLMDGDNTAQGRLFQDIAYPNSSICAGVELSPGRRSGKF